MSKMDQKLKRRMQKRQMRVIQGESKRAATVAADATKSEFSPLVRFDLSLASFLKEYLKLEATRPADDRLTQNNAAHVFLRFAAGSAIAAGADDEQFLKAAAFVFDQEREATKGDEDA